MKKKPAVSLHHRNLIRRYLYWAYKSTKESFERIERKTTQLRVDEFILDHFAREKWDMPDEFKSYVTAKQKEQKKFNPEYLYLKNRLSAIEEAIKYFLGAKELKRAQQLFEEEFTRRIWESRDH
jgi:hypothetical protein